MGKILATFSAARDGGVMAIIDGKISFPGRRDWGKRQPLPGETWEVTITGSNASGRVNFLRAVRSPEEIQSAAWAGIKSTLDAFDPEWVKVVEPDFSAPIHPYWECFFEEAFPLIPDIRDMGGNFLSLKQAVEDGRFRGAPGHGYYAGWKRRLEDLQAGSAPFTAEDVDYVFSQETPVIVIEKITENGWKSPITKIALGNGHFHVVPDCFDSMDDVFRHLAANGDWLRDELWRQLVRNEGEALAVETWRPRLRKDWYEQCQRFARSVFAITASHAREESEKLLLEAFRRIRKEIEGPVQIDGSHWIAPGKMGVSFAVDGYEFRYLEKPDSYTAPDYRGRMTTYNSHGTYLEILWEGEWVNFPLRLPLIKPLKSKEYAIAVAVIGEAMTELYPAQNASFYEVSGVA